MTVAAAGGRRARYKHNNNIGIGSGRANGPLRMRGEALAVAPQRPCAYSHGLNPSPCPQGDHAMTRRLPLVCGLITLLVSGACFWSPATAVESLPMIGSTNVPQNIRTVLDGLEPLENARGERELIYQYSVGDLSALPDEEATLIIRELAARGIGVMTFWRGGQSQDASIAEGIRIGRIQQSLGLRVVCDANSLLYRFYDGTPATAHVGEDGQPFFDETFAGSKMGCPFAIEHRKPVILARVAAFAEAYHAAGVSIGMVTADWEIDGPHEWNGAWEHSKRCTRCREHLPNIEDFTAFQATMRRLRSELMRDCYVGPILFRFPNALVTNYAIYPNDGWRYWYDYFEAPQPDLPHRRFQNDLFRPWYNDFTESGFTLAMPVVYTWHNIYHAYPEFSDDDYRWFFNMLLVGSNAGKSTPPGIPIATFVHWHTTAAPATAEGIPQMSANAYQELLWHLLLRGHDILCSWTPMNELEEEIRLVQQVYDASLPYSEWITEGTPITFDVPTEQGPVISGVRLGNRVLVRRSDFGEPVGSIDVIVDGRTISVPSMPGTMQVFELE